ncbi:MAG: hypothetical protein JWN30_300, partial [Bacilli bacterium]|nr:hypothetical protein [Bacilli bacterium]
ATSPVSIAFWNTQQGLLVSSTNGQGSIWKTTDGGQNWTNVYVYKTPFSRVVVTGGTSAKVLVGINWSTPSSQLVTSNNGQTWEEQAYQQPSFAQAACGTDTFVNHSASSPSQIWSLCTGQPGAGQMGKRIVSSTDGGKTWTIRANVNPAGGSSNGLSVSGYPAGIDFLANGRGWLWESRGFSYYTTDGGQNWTPFTNLTQPESKEARSMSLIDDQHGYALLWDNNRYRLMFTADGGRSWHEVKSWAE